MRSTGFVRKVDVLGRITIPSEMRVKMDLGAKDAVEIFEDREFMLIKKYEPCDLFTGEMEDLIDFEGKKVSRKSIIRMAKKAGFKIVDPDADPHQRFR